MVRVLLRKDAGGPMSVLIPVPRRMRERGFTMIELMLVLGIIGIMVAVAVPNIMEYLRTARIRAAANDVSAALQEARQKAIARNARYGVVLVTRSNQEFQWIVEDDMIPPIVSATRSALSDLIQIGFTGLGQAGRPSALPSDVTFDTAGASYFVRFDNYGRACDPSTCAAPNKGTLTTVNAVYDNGTSPYIVLRQQGTGFIRTLCISAGGRVRISSTAGCS